MPAGLNRWRQGTDSGWYVPQGLNAGGVTASQYSNDLKFSIDNNFPLLGNVQQEPNDAHLHGHPVGQRLWHIIPIYGYSSRGANTHYADPVHGTSFWSWSSSVPAYAAYDSNTLASRMLVYRGYVW